MNISPQLAQGIVDRTMKIINKNVNIMDETAHIIGSGDQSRIGEFHYAAAMAIAENRPIEVSKDNMEELRCTRTGINLPMVLNGRIVGVVGITGEPDEVRGYAELLKETVELMLQQSLLTEESQLRREAHAHLVADLITESSEITEGTSVARAELLGFKLEIPRVAVLLSFYQGDGRTHSFPGGLAGGREGLEGQKLRNRVIELIRTSFATDPQDMLAFTSGDQVVVLKCITPMYDREHADSWKKDLRAACEELRGQLTGYVNGETTFGIGTPVTKPSTISASYAEALSACQVGRKLFGPPRIYFIDELGIAELIRELSSSTRKRFVDRTIGGLLGGGRENSRLLATLDVYFKCDRNLKQASERLYVHRNTLLHRLERVHQLTGLDPRKFSDALQLQMALMLNTCNNTCNTFPSG